MNRHGLLADKALLFADIVALFADKLGLFANNTALSSDRTAGFVNKVALFVNKMTLSDAFSGNLPKIPRFHIPRPIRCDAAPAGFCDTAAAN